MMLFSPLLCDYRLDENFETLPVTLFFCCYKVQKQVSTCHNPCLLQIDIPLNSRVSLPTST